MRFGTQGANRLGATQSSVSAALAEMQAHLGQRLFAHRPGYALRLTEEGRRIRPLVRSILKEVADLESPADSTELEGRLTIGATSTIGDRILPALCAAFKQRHPKIAMTVLVGSEMELLHRFESLEIETALIENSVSLSQVTLTPWRHDELWLVVSPSHPLAGEVAALSDLAGHQWCLREARASISIRLRLALQPLIGRLPVALEINSNAGLLEAVSQGLGIGCLSRTLVEPLVARGELARLAPSGFELVRQFQLVRVKGVPRDRVAAAFDAFLLGLESGAGSPARTGPIVQE